MIESTPSISKSHQAEPSISGKPTPTKRRPTENVSEDSMKDFTLKMFLFFVVVVHHFNKTEVDNVAYNSLRTN